MNKKRKQSGFTLIELLIVVTILTVLAVSVFVALNPSQRLIDAKNARRTSDVDTILTAIHESIVDNKGSNPTNLPAAGDERQLGTGSSCTLNSIGGCLANNVTCADLTAGAQNLNPYLKSIPIDPITTTYNATKTGYAVLRDSNGIVTIKSCAAENATGSPAINIWASR